MNLKKPHFQDVVIAYDRIVSFIHKTPILTSATVNPLTGATLYFKCENFPKVSAFKYRGATNTIFPLSGEEMRIPKRVSY